MTPATSDNREATSEPHGGPKISGMAVVAVVAGVVAALAAVLALWQQRGGDPAPMVDVNSGRDTTCVAAGPDSSCVSNILQRIIEESEDDEEFKAKIAEYSTEPPTGEGPWMFYVVDTDGLGLKVRDDPGRAGRQIGTAANREPVWATCKVRNDFDPEPHTGVGPVWLNVGWPSNTPGTDFSGSQITDPPHGWVYRAYVVPVGHNGDIPDCA